MDRNERILTVPAAPLEFMPQLARVLQRRKPRAYAEWKALRSWDKLPVWEDDPPGYLLRRLREDADCTQQELARRLGCSQQAVAQAERWGSNPTVKFAREWARVLGQELIIAFRPIPTD